jgi:hypothetical protein
MNVAGVATLRKPRTDPRPIWDFLMGFCGVQALCVAHHLGLFPLLDERPRTVAEVSESLGLDARPAQAMLSTCTAAGLLELRGDQYALTLLAEEYLLESSPTFYGPLLDLVGTNPRLTSYADWEKAVRTNTAQAYGGEKIFEAHEAQAELARGFTKIMHTVSVAPALSWPDVRDLSPHSVMLDVGGGSGAHSIGAAMRWPQLQATVFDIPPVCEVAEEFIGSYGLSERISTQAGDMWQDDFPAADLHFYSNIYHDWPPEKGRFLTEKSHAALPSGGRIVIHETLFNDDKAGPLVAAEWSMVMVMWTEGQQYSGAELATTLTDAGFRDIEVKRTFAYDGVVSGVKR